MTIAETREKCKSWVGKAPRDVLIIAILVLASSASFGLGYLTGLDAGKTVADGQGSGVLAKDLLPTTTSENGQFVASRSGTKYYLTTCAAAGRISEANKIWFASASAAHAAGYAPAANCKGL